jgi:hypothetical protein
MGTRMICSVAVVACFAAGCGGGSSGGSGAGSAPPTTTAPTTAKSAPTKQQVMSNALWKFLDRVRPLRARSNRFEHAAGVADTHVSSTAYSGWAAAASANADAARISKGVADALAAIVPPVGLRPVYRAYVAGYRTDALIASDLAAALRSHTYLNWDTFDARYNASAEPVTRFRIALIQYAAVNHLRLPRWVHSIGGK